MECFRSRRVRRFRSMSVALVETQEQRGTTAADTSRSSAAAVVGRCVGRPHRRWVADRSSHRRRRWWRRSRQLQLALWARRRWWRCNRRRRRSGRSRATRWNWWNSNRRWRARRRRKYGLLWRRRSRWRRLLRRHCRSRRQLRWFELRSRWWVELCRSVRDRLKSCCGHQPRRRNSAHNDTSAKDHAERSGKQPEHVSTDRNTSVLPSSRRHNANRSHCKRWRRLAIGRWCSSRSCRCHTGTNRQRVSWRSGHRYNCGLQRRRRIGILGLSRRLRARRRRWV